MKLSQIIAGYTIAFLCFITIFLALPIPASAQQSLMVNMAAVDGIAITPPNIFGYQIQSSAAVNVDIKGTIRYRNSGLSLSYTFSYTLKSGMNQIDKNIINPHWQFSSNALRELFTNYNVLPAGTFEYCVDITPVNTPKENNANTTEECLYHRGDDFFLINLIDPADKSKIKEYNPMLTWIANYSFSNELTYRLRVAEIKQGQNAINAIQRNQPIYSEQHITQNSMIYPIYAKPLKANQLYAWTVDAYYKDILLGGAETWQFIIPDSLPVAVSESRSYIDIKRESGLNMLTALGTLKLKYVLDDAKKDVLSLKILNDKSTSYSINPTTLNAVFGDNRYTLDLFNTANLKHKGRYTLKITTQTGHEYKLAFQYLNPEYQH